MGNFAEKSVAVFEQRRPFLLGLAYRILGSRAEAEDAMQELFIKWLEADQASIAAPAAWLSHGPAMKNGGVPGACPGTGAIAPLHELQDHGWSGRPDHSKV